MHAAMPPSRPTLRGQYPFPTVRLLVSGSCSHSPCVTCHARRRPWGGGGSTNSVGWLQMYCIEV